MARSVEYTTPEGHRIGLQMALNGRETVLYDGEVVSTAWNPIFPGDHEFKVQEAGEWVVYALKGYTLSQQVYEWRFSRNGKEFLRVH